MSDNPITTQYHDDVTKPFRILFGIACLIAVLGFVAWSQLRTPKSTPPQQIPYLISYQQSTTNGGVRVANLIVHATRFGLRELRDAAIHLNGSETNHNVVVLNILRLDP